MNKKVYIKKYFVALTFFCFGIYSAACSGEPLGRNRKAASSGDTINIQGSGASFPKPIYEKWASEFGKINAKVRIDYQASGSGAGQKAVLAKTSDFGASDEPLSEADIKNADAEIFHIPTVLGAVVLTYNLPKIEKPLNLSAAVIADIYLGNIRKWNDARIMADNSETVLPDADILPIYRADSSGTSAVFTDFLSKTVPVWKEKVGTNKQPSWITGVGVGAKGNDGVMGQVKQTPNSIAYVELSYAKANDLPMAQIKNKVGNFIEPSLETVTAAAESSTAQMPEDLRFQITDADGANAYPMASYTYILVYKNQTDAVKGRALAEFLWWATHDGKRFVKNLHYAPLPAEVIERVEAKINSMTANGTVIRQTKTNGE